MAYGDVPPNFDGLPPEAVPWARYVTSELKTLGKNQGRDSQRISNAISTGQGALSVSEAQGQQISDTQQQIADTDQQVYVQRVSDVVNVFDMTPIVERSTEKLIVEPSSGDPGSWSITEWFSDGFTIASTVAQTIDIVSATPQSYFLGAKIGARYFLSVNGTTVNAEIYPRMTWENGTRSHPGYGPWISSTSTGWTDTARATNTLPQSQGIGGSNTVAWAPVLTLTFSAANSSYTVRGLQVFQSVGQPAVPEWVSGPQAYLRGNLFYDLPILEQTGADRWNGISNGLNDPARVSSWSFVPGGLQVTVKAGQWIYLSRLNPPAVRGRSRVNVSVQVTQMSAPGFTGTAPRVFFQGQILRSQNSPEPVFIQQSSVGTLQTYLDLPADATYLDIALDAHAASDVDTTFTILNPFVGDLVQQNELDPSITFGVPDGAVTDVKVTGPITGTKISAASQTARGSIEIATDAEVQAGTSALLAVTPASLAAWEALIRPNRFRAVFIGNSNVTATHPVNSSWITWPTLLCASRGWTQHNYAMNSQSFTTSGTIYNQLAQNAVNGMTAAQRAEVGYVFVCDGSSDARAAVSYSTLFTAAKQVYQTVRTGFPNARIVVVPQIWPADSQYYTPGTWNPAIPAAVIGTSVAQADALSEVDPRGIYMDQSWSWLTARDQYMIQQSDVHPNAAGHALLANYINRGLDGETIVTRTLWTPVPTASGYTETSTDFRARTRPLSVSRIGWEVTLEGFTQTTAARGGPNFDIGGPSGTGTPRQFRPAYSTHGDSHKIILGGGTGASVPIEIWSNGYLRCTGTLSANEGVMVNARYLLG